MTKAEIIKKIEELKNRKFFLAMKDHWTIEDSFRDTELWNEIRRLEEELKKVEA